MSFRDDKIALLNYNPFAVHAVTETRTYVIDPCLNENIPTFVNVSFSDVEYINSQSNAFRTGLLFFKDNQKEEIYKELSIFDWKDILTNKEIKDIMLNPTMDGLKKLLNVKDVVTFDRIYAILVSLQNSNSYDLSNRVIKVIEARQKEIRRKIFNTQIILQERDTAPAKKLEDVSELKAQNAEMAKKLEDMQNMMAEFMKAQQSNKKTSDVETTTIEEPKKVGRSKSTK
jgi:hypothetical protein